MAEYRNTSRLVYVDAGEVSDDRVNFDGLDVLDTAGRKLGDVEGFVVQRGTNRPYYLVVDSGGWFSSRSFLLPIGHARLDAANKALRVDVDKSTIQQFPEFDRDRLAEMSDEDVQQFTHRTLSACCGKELAARTGPDRYDFDKWSHYNQPDWWRSGWFSGRERETTLTDRNRPAATYDTDYSVPPASVPAASREHIMARDRDVADRDEVVDEHPLNRAQPGDVLGVENAGKTTSLGETGRDERKRLDNVEEDAADLRRDERKK